MAVKFTAIFILHRKMKFKTNKKPDAQHTLAYVSNRAIAV